jgi:hypothetical protein
MNFMLYTNLEVCFISVIVHMLTVPHYAVTRHRRVHAYNVAAAATNSCIPAACPLAGNISGTVPVSPLALQPDTSWLLKFTPTREESLTLRLTIDGQVAGTQVVTIAGRSLSFLALNASLQQASLVSQGLAATSLITEGALLMAYLEESSYAYVPIVDKAGAR